MTNLVWSEDRWSGHYEIKLSGHALSNRAAGQNIVCAALSTLAYTCLAAVMDDDLIGYDFEIRADAGFAKIAFWPAKKRGKIHCRIIFDVIMGGYQMIQSRYPDQLTISDQEK